MLISILCVNMLISLQSIQRSLSLCLTGPLAFPMFFLFAFSLSRLCFSLFGGKVLLTVICQYTDGQCTYLPFQEECHKTQIIRWNRWLNKRIIKKMRHMTKFYALTHEVLSFLCIYYIRKSFWLFLLFFSSIFFLLFLFSVFFFFY